MDKGSVLGPVPNYNLYAAHVKIICPFSLRWLPFVCCLFLLLSPVAAPQWGRAGGQEGASMIYEYFYSCLLVRCLPAHVNPQPHSPAAINVPSTHFIAAIEFDQM